VKKASAAAGAFLCLFPVLFEGGFGKCGAQRWFFCGEFVVDCVVNVVSLMVDFPR